MSTDLFATAAFRDIPAGEILQLLGLFLVKVKLGQVTGTVLVDPKAHGAGRRGERIRRVTGSGMVGMSRIYESVVLDSERD